VPGDQTLGTFSTELTTMGRPPIGDKAMTDAERQRRHH
jgi:hypothetical protein